eukprot:Polyplicarium_translucidae@DN1311_c0_g1_i1.p1
MKLNIANKATSLMKTIQIDDEKKFLPFIERRMGAEVAADALGEEFKGYVFRITGGCDKDGFPMMQGILLNRRTRLLFRPGMKCYNPKRKGSMKRKSVRGCIVGNDLAVLNVAIVKKGDDDIPGLTDSSRPRRLGPKRASHIRRLFNVDNKADLTKLVIRRQIDGKKKTKAPKIQRLVTPKRLQRKRRLAAIRHKHHQGTAAAMAEWKVKMEEYHKKKKASLSHPRSRESPAVE